MPRRRRAPARVPRLRSQEQAPARILA
jgi:hypothetical protein